MRVAAFDVGFLNMVLCIVDTLPDSTFTVVRWERWQVGNPDTTAAVLVELLVRRLHEDFAVFYGVDVVVIERQMVAKLSILAHAIQTFFTTRKLLAGHGPGAVLQHGTRKNQCGQWLVHKGQPMAAGGKGYACNKRRAVEDSRAALQLQPDSKWRELFEAEAKKDDMADALLHALWFALLRPGAPPLKPTKSKRKRIDLWATNRPPAAIICATSDETP